VSVIVIGNIGVGLFISQIEDYDEKVEISGYFIYPKERGGKEGGREREREDGSLPRSLHSIRIY